MENVEIHVITLKEQEGIQAILDSRLLDTKNGSAIIHFDKDGTIQKIEVNKVAFRRFDLS